MIREEAVLWGLALGVVTLASPASAGQAKAVWATGGTRAEVQSAVDALGGPGVVVIPPGAWQLTGTVKVTHDDVTILGSGASLTRLYHASDNPDEEIEKAPFFSVAGTRSAPLQRFRMAHLRIDGVAAAASDAHDLGLKLGNVVDFRVDHCVFAHHGYAGVSTGGVSRGVVDHSKFLETYKPNVEPHLGYGVVVYGTDEFSSPKIPFGSREATFIEDSYFSGTRHAAAANSAARYVFRHNHVTNNKQSHAVDAHGAEPAPNGTEWIEVYENLIDNPAVTYAGVKIRGGGGAVWKNRIHGYDAAVYLSESTSQPTGWVYVWGNTVSAGTTPVSPTSTDPSPALEHNGLPDYKKEPPPNYTPYSYPHPLVIDLDVNAGPDQATAVSGDGLAEVWLDASQTTAKPGNVASYRWREGNAVLSSCKQDVVKLAPGVHVLLLEATRDDGLTEHDTAVVRVAAAGPLLSTPEWASRRFVPLVSSGSVRFRLKPKLASQNAYVALAGLSAVAAHEDSAAILRTNPQGKFDVRKGSAYAADTALSYSAGKSYEIVMRFDIPGQRYSVTVDGTAIATDYPFRSSEKALAQLIAWHDGGGLSVEEVLLDGEQARPEAACLPSKLGDAGGGAVPPSGQDGSAPAGADGGVGELRAEPAAGCGCSTSGRAPGMGSLLALLLAAVWVLPWVREGRRRGQRTCRLERQRKRRSTGTQQPLQANGPGMR